MFSHPTAHMMRRRYNSAPGFLQQKQYDINIHNYNVGVFNQYLGGPASAPSPSPQMSAVAMCNHGNLPEQTPAPFARAGLNTTQLSTNVQLNQVPTRHQPTITDLSSTRSVLDDHSGQDQSQLKYSTTSTDEMTNYQIANNGVGHTDWNSTHTSSSSFIPIPSPLPWSMCADSHQALPNSTTSENTVPNCQWLPISEGSTSGFNPAIFSTPASHSNWSTTIPRPLNSTATHQVPQHDKTHCNDPQTKPRSCHSMYPSADELSQHYLTLLQQVFPEHNSTALQHVLDRCGGDIINALENILACHAYREGLLKTCMEVLTYPPASKDESTQPQAFTSFSETETLDTPATTPQQTSTTFDDLWSPQSAQLLTPSDLGQLQELN